MIKKTEPPATPQACFVALGANLRDPAETVRKAAAQIAALPQISRPRCSSLYRTAPHQTSDAQPDYVNAVIGFETQQPISVLWSALTRIEAELGRERSGERNAARQIDIDFLLYGELRQQTPTLTLPHPRMHERAFVLLPLAEIAPTLQIPGLGPISALLDAVRGQRIETLSELACS